MSGPGLVDDVGWLQIRRDEDVDHAAHCRAVTRNRPSPVLTQPSRDNESRTAHLGVNVRRLFVSYARVNKRDVDQLVDLLELAGYHPWVDGKLRGGQRWWQEVLREIAESDAFLAMVSRDSLNSTACRYELDWAEALGKPVLPVAVEPLSIAMPSRLSSRQIVDYSQPGLRDRAALQVAGSLSALPPAPPLPDDLPDLPPAPLSYLTDLIDMVGRSEPLDHEQQRQTISKLEPALRSVDPEERNGGRDILAWFRSRADLYEDVALALSQLSQVHDGESRPISPVSPSTAGGPEPSPEDNQLPQDFHLVDAPSSVDDRPEPDVPVDGHRYPRLAHARQRLRRLNINMLAIASLCAALLGFITAGIGWVVGFFIGLSALRQIRETHQRGRRIAITGMVISAAMLFVLCVMFVLDIPPTFDSPLFVK
jgi:TIR domain/Domain of unknown function (DUF4190)